MTIRYSPPHVVHAAYAQSCFVANIEDLWMKLSHEVYVIEQRLSAELMESLQSALLTLSHEGTVKRVDLKTLYKPVYFGKMVEQMPGYDNPVAEPTREGQGPTSWWLRLDLVEPSERIRFPALPAKVNMTEWFNLGEHRELYSYDGFGFTLRDNYWGRD